MPLGWVLARFKSSLAPSDSCGGREQGVPVAWGRAVSTGDPGPKKRGWLPWTERGSGVLIAKILWTQGLAWMSPPGSLRHEPFSSSVVVVVPSCWAGGPDYDGNAPCHTALQGWGRWHKTQVPVQLLVGLETCRRAPRAELWQGEAQRRSERRGEASGRGGRGRSVSWSVLADRM